MTGYQSGAQWPAFKGCSTRIGQASVYGPAQIDTASPKTWSRSLGQDAGSPTIAADGTIYVNSGTYLYAYTAAGVQKWRVNVSGAAQSGQAIASDGTVYLAAGNRLVAVNPNGTIKWAYTGSFGATITSSPLIGPDGAVYVGEDFGSFIGNVFAIKANGTLKWQVTADAVASTFLMSADGTAVYVGAKNGGMRAMRASDGGTIWDHAFAFGATGTGAVGSDGVVYAGGAAGILLALNPADGSEQWQFNQGAPMANSPVIGPDGTLYTSTIGVPGSVNGKLFAITKAGIAKWSIDLGGLTAGSPIVDAGGNVYIGTLSGSVQAIAPNGGRLWSYQTGDAVYATPAFANDGTLLIGSNDDKLYSFGGGRSGVCGPDSGCTVAGAAGEDTYVRAAQPAASFGSTTPLVVGYDTQENRALVRFYLDDVFRGVHKRAEVLNAKLVLPRTAVGTGSGSGVLTANPMTRGWTSAGATWTCANDTNPSSTVSACQTADVWSMTGTTVPYTTTGAATSSVTFSATRDIVVDVTSAFKQAISNDAVDVSWILRLTTGAGSIKLGSQESGSPARLLLTVGPDTQATQRRNDKLAAIAAATSSPLKEGRANWTAWASACEMRRAVDGLSTNTKFTAYAATLDADDRAAVRKIAADYQDIPAGTAATLLGPFAAIDPRACQQEPSFATAALINKNRETESTGRLRAPYCPSGDGSITVGSDVVDVPRAAGDVGSGYVPGSGRIAGKARPTVIGVDPTLYTPMTGNLSAVVGEFGAQPLVDDWVNNRGGNVSNTTGLYPGDGLSPFGVSTSTPCTSSTTYATDPCDHTKGLICSSLVGAGLSPARCLAFPIITQGEDIQLRGTNFWDSEAILKYTRINPGAPGLDKQVAIESNGNDGGAINSCKVPGLIGSNPSLFVLPNKNHNTLRFPVTAGANFYRIELFNRNGQFRTSADAFAGSSTRHEIHVCRNQPNQENYFQGTDPTSSPIACTEPTSTCIDDGQVPCAAGTWASAPRPLSSCLGTLEPGDPDKCVETPTYFGSEGRMYVYVQNERPKYTYRSFLDRLECTEETGCDHCGGDDEIASMYFSATETQLNSLGKSDPKQLADGYGAYRNDFNDGQIRTPEFKYPDQKNVRRSEQIYAFYQNVEEDGDSVKRTKVIGGLVAVGASAVGGAYGGAGGAAAAGGAVKYLNDRIIDGVKRADNLGGRVWAADYWGVTDRVALTHQSNFLQSYIANPNLMSALPMDLPENSTGTFSSALLHPIVGYGRDLSSTTVECSAPSNSCSSGSTCYINQCIGTSERDGAADLSWSGGFSSGAADDPTWDVGYRARLDLSKNGGRYKGDLEFVVCPENVPSSQYVTVKERCRGVGTN